MPNRRWITREEIAEIYDSLAAHSFAKMVGDEEPADFEKARTDLSAYNLKADQVRATELLSRPVGWRTA